MHYTTKPPGMQEGFPSNPIFQTSRLVYDVGG